MKRRIAISQRMIKADQIDEWRDCLSIEWQHFFLQFSEELIFLPAPNLGAYISEWSNELAIDGVVLSGGGEVGHPSLRGTSESELLAWSRKNGKPVLGVCRGAQVLYEAAGGRLVSISDHVAVHHKVQLSGLALQIFPQSSLIVNSYHELGFGNPIPDSLESVAMTNEGSCEAFTSQCGREWGIMWHPEREGQNSSFDQALIEYLFIGQRWQNS